MKRLLPLLLYVGVMGWCLGCAAGAPAGEPPAANAQLAADDAWLPRLADFGISPAQLAAHVDGHPLEKEPAGMQLLLRFLLRLEPLTPSGIQRWATATQDIVLEAKADPPPARGQFYSAAGRVRRVETVKLAPRDAERYLFDHYYRCSCVLGQSATEAVIYTRNVPRSWLESEKKETAQLDERITVAGVYLGRGARQGDHDVLLMVAKRVAWHPDSLLGGLDVDVGLLDNVTDGVNPEPEPFFQLLTAGRRLGSDEAMRLARSRLSERHAELVKRRDELTRREAELKTRLSQAQPQSPEAGTLAAQANNVTEELLRLKEQIAHVENDASELLPLLMEPAHHRGELALIRCVATRILPVKVTDPELRRRFGLDHYYQIDALASLELDVKLPAPKGEKPAESEQRSTYPVTFCVRKLPAGLPEGEGLHEEIVVPAFFLKHWAFNATEIDGSQGEGGTALLFIAHQPLRVVPPEQGTWAAGMLAGVLFAVVVAGIAIAMWRVNRSDRRLQSARRARLVATEEGTSLNELGLEAAAAPDFRNWNGSAAAPAAIVSAPNEQQSEPTPP